MEDRMQYTNDEERLVAEQAVLNYRELREVMKNAPHGKGMAVLEQAVRDKGFAQMRQTLGLLASAQDETLKKNGVNSRPCTCGASAYFKGGTKKTLLTVVGEVEVRRRYYSCRKCHANDTPFDAWSGLGAGMATPAARRMLALAGMSFSFDVAADRLAELCLLKVSNDTIRRVSEEEGQAAQEFLAQSDVPAQAFAKGQGEVEFYTDGVTVNTTEGWRDLRLSVFDKREAGAPATPAQWAKRVLPPPSVRVAWASMAACEQQGQAWQRQTAQLGISADEPLSVLADGAKWIWDQARQCWRQAQWVLDVFHVSEHIHDCGKALYGESGGQARLWSEAQVQSLIENGPVQYLQDLQADAARHHEPAKLKALAALRGYLTPHVDSMWYKQRLADGRPIGSGLIEGANKTIVSNRLKLNSARWTPDHAEHISALRCLDYSGLWADFWRQRAA